MILRDEIIKTLYGVYWQGKHDGEAPYDTEERTEKDFEQDADAIIKLLFATSDNRIQQIKEAQCLDSK